MAFGAPLVFRSDASADTNSVTSGAIDTTGAHLLVVLSSSFESATEPTLTDSKSNTWVALTPQPMTASARARLYYCANPTVGSGHTFTLTGTGTYCSILVAAWVEAAGATFDPTKESGTTFTGTPDTVQPGSITPSVNDCLVLTGGAYAGPAGAIVDSGFTIIDDEPASGGVCFGACLAYKVQTTAAAVNPTWTCTATWASGGIVMAAFKPAGGGGGGGSVPKFLNQYRQRRA